MNLRAQFGKVMIPLSSFYVFAVSGAYKHHCYFSWFVDDSSHDKSSSTQWQFKNCHQWELLHDSE
jgi:hypothetical protein